MIQLLYFYSFSSVHYDQFSHHSKVSVIVTLQNLYTNSRYGKTFYRQASEIVMFQDRTDLTQVKTVSSKMFGKSDYLSNCFQFIRTHLTEQVLRYLVIDCSNISLLEENMKVRTNIFPTQDGKVQPIFFFQGGN